MRGEHAGYEKAWLWNVGKVEVKPKSQPINLAVEEILAEVQVVAMEVVEAHSDAWGRITKLVDKHGITSRMVKEH